MSELKNNDITKLLIVSCLIMLFVSIGLGISLVNQSIDLKNTKLLKEDYKQITIDQVKTIADLESKLKASTGMTTKEKDKLIEQWVLAKMDFTMAKAEVKVIEARSKVEIEKLKRKHTEFLSNYKHKAIQSFMKAME